MSALRLPGFGSLTRRYNAQGTEYILAQRPLARVLAMIGRTIDDVVNDPIAKNQVLGYYKLYRQIERRSEIIDLEKQWNATG